MDVFKETQVEGLVLGRPASTPTEAVRRDELDEELSAKADKTQVDSDLAASVHDPVTIGTSETLELALAGQELAGEVKFAAASSLQAAASARVNFFNHPVAAASILQADRIYLTAITVLRVNSSNGLIATGVLGTDYIVDMALGRVTILTGSNLITASTQKVKLTFDCAELLSGPGVKNDGGVTADFGAGHHQVPRGDHRHSELHSAAAGQTTNSSVVTVDPLQRIKVDVKIDSAGGLQLTSNGLREDPAKIPGISHGHANATTGAAGFMSPTDKTKLDNLAPEVISVANTSTVVMAKTGSQITAAVKLSTGLTTDGTGVAVDFAQVASSSHKHLAVMAVNVINVTNGGSGYTTAPITISGGAAGGHGCVATATIVGGIITAITVTEPGFRYRQSNPPNIVIGGDGTGAAAVAIVNEAGGFLSKTAALDLLSLL